MQNQMKEIVLKAATWRLRERAASLQDPHESSRAPHAC